MSTNDSSSTKSDAWLHGAIRTLTDAGISTARLDALVLLEDITNKDRTHLLAHPELELTHEQRMRLDKLIQRRKSHVPLAYLRGKTEFYGREFIVSEAVLEPRPESETMIELLKQLELTSPKVADIGSGSGALGITAALELPGSHVDLLEIDANALAVSALNTKKLAPRVQTYQSDLLEMAPRANYDVILANLPYVPDSYTLNEAAMNEPKLAIFGGDDGLDPYRRMFAQLKNYTHVGTFVLTESLPFQHADLANIARAQNFELQKKEDFIQVFRRIK